MLEKLAYPASIVAFILVALVWPTLRTWRRERVWPIVFHREAAPAQRLIGVLLTALFVALPVWGFLVAFADPDGLALLALPAGFARAGWVLMAAGTVLVVAAQRRMGAAWRIGIDDRPTELVTTGAFALCRNPIFTGMLIAFAGALLIAPSPWSALVYAGTAVSIPVQVRYEERHLAALHGAAYAAYASRVGRFFPLIGRLPTAERAASVTRIA